MLWLFAKSVIAGVLASVPLGPVAALVVSKTLQGGRTSGFVTGLGSTAVDTFYAFAGILAVTAVERFVSDNTTAINLIGGALVILLGLYMLLGRVQPVQGAGKLSGFAQAALCAVANPGALVLMIALVAFMDLRQIGFPAVCGVSLGSMLWWWFLSGVLSRYRGKFSLETLATVVRVLGLGIVIFGIVWIIKAFLATGL